MTPPSPSPDRRTRTRFEMVRDPILLLVGISVLFHEVLIAPEPRELLLLLIAGCFGLPAMTGIDQLLVRRATPSAGSPPEPTPPVDEPSTPTGPPSSGAA